MKICYAFDRDGTVETSNGVVPLSLIERLKGEGHYVYAYGNVKLSSEAGIPYAEGDTKEERLRNLRLKVKADKYIVVDDMHIKVEGWQYLRPEEFLSNVYGKDEGFSAKALRS